MTDKQKITQDQFNKLKRNKDGYLVVPAYSDLSEIKKFPEKVIFGEGCSFGKSCSFGEGCSFGKWCSFGEGCKLNNLTIINYKCVDRIGEYKRKLYCFSLEGKLFFQAGCFFGTEKELKEEVLSKYGKNSEYMLAIEFLKKIIKMGKHD